MSPSLAFNRYWWILVVFVLSACTGVAVKEPVSGGKAIYQQRVANIAAINEWSFAGKISIDDGDQGGNGRLQWNVFPDSAEIDFHGALGRGAWHLHIDPAVAILKQANGDEHSAASVNDLIQERIGWPLPVDALQWWVRGLSAPGVVENEQFDPGGLVISLDQFGWHIEISRYKTYSGLDLPVRLDARRDNYRVKMAISRWQMGRDSQQ
jgi:outer membrane lipoprotein LolB